MIPVFKPEYNTAKILQDLEVIFNSGWTGLGPKCDEFEAKSSEFLGADYSVFMNSCTSALHIAIECLQLPKLSKIIVPDITFVSTASAVIYAGHIPILAPCDDVSLCLDLGFVEAAMKNDKEVLCVIPVHYSGNCCDMDRLVNLCDQYSVKLIEDCAHAFGSQYKGKPVGTFGEMGCFSFHSVKNLPIGDGGLVIGKSEYQEPLRRLRWMGIDKSTYQRTGTVGYSYSYDIQEVGWKYHGNDLMAVVGIRNLELIADANRRRRAIHARYVAGLPELTIHSPREGVLSAQHLVSCMIENRDGFIDFMKDQDICIGVHYKPLSSFSAFSTYASPEVKDHNQQIFLQLATLPCYPSLSEEDQNQVIDKTKAFLSRVHSI